MAGEYPFTLADPHAIYGGVPFLLPITATSAGTSTYYLFDGGASSAIPFGAPRSFRIIRVWGAMTGAGAAGDTVVVQDGAGNAITDTVDVSALAQNDAFDAAVLNASNYVINKGENLRIVTASDALVRMFILCVWEA